MKASLVASATASHPWSAGNAIEKLMQNISVLAAGGGGQYTLDCWIDRDTGGGQYTLDCWIDRDTGVTGDETWVYSWNPETKRHSTEWTDFDEPRPEKVRPKQGALKVMHMIFFDMNGVILRWPVPIGTTINAQYYKKVLQDKLRPAIRKKRPGLLESGIVFHHDNAPVHTARAVTDILAGYKWELLEHPRYSPDLAPCDFHLFLK
ncbi:hypothetical protein RRG08_056666 [Elysia crispata]|uniref:Transposase n=1 Tax=Elysia crispata TaxID=231223 RepID=A0AAE0YGC0_9GAST|nr:hypothetical protein RRG08_056666 [Elysia crispata]